MLHIIIMQLQICMKSVAVLFTAVQGTQAVGVAHCPLARGLCKPKTKCKSKRTTVGSKKQVSVL